MNVPLSKDLEQIVQDAVHSGLYARGEDVIRDALIRLKQTLLAAPNKASRNRKVREEARSEKLPVTSEELNRRLLASGLVIQVPDPTEDTDDPGDLPIEIDGEPLSETILCERRRGGCLFPRFERACQTLREGGWHPLDQGSDPVESPNFTLI